MRWHACEGKPSLGCPKEVDFCLHQESADSYQMRELILIRAGDFFSICLFRSSARVVTCCPDWAERNERIFEEIRDLLRGSSYEKDYLKKPDYVT